MSIALDEARVYEKEKQKLIKKEQRPSFHISSPVGWINDPNGFSVYKGEYHLFYQYHPYSTQWGPMHWGHSKTKDLIKWEQLPVAIAPDTEYDGQGCFSGSAIEYDDKHFLMYTGVMDKRDKDGNHIIRQTQCIAVGDGIDYEKMDCNPVITSDLLPEGSSLEDFRDPKIWKEDGVFYSVVGSRNEDGSGQIALFSSKDLKEWKFVTILDQSKNVYGRMWECPDFFSLNDKHALIISPQEVLAEGLEFHNGNNVVSIIGDYDKENFKFVRDSVSQIDYGLDFYAPQTLESLDGRRIMIGWMQSWDNHIIPEGSRWSGMMTIPRELSIENGKLIQVPVREIENYYKNEVVHENVKVTENTKLDGISGREIDMTVEILEGDYKEFKIAVAENEKYATYITYNGEKNIVSFDRRYSGIKRDIIHTREMYVNDNGGKIKLRILMDKYSVEVFVNNGEQAMTSIIYTPLDANNISFSTDGKVRANVVKRDVVVE